VQIPDGTFELVAMTLTVGGVFVTVGMNLAQLATLKTRVSSLERSRDRQGERIGHLETHAAVTTAVEEHSRPYRTSLGPFPVTPKTPKEPPDHE
jgi:hypothetical protein